MAGVTGNQDKSRCAQRRTDPNLKSGRIVVVGCAVRETWRETQNPYKEYTV